jgi:UDP-N-acetylmuramate-alanine ligase
LLDAEVRSPAVVLVMSAGDATKISEAFLARRQARFAGSV